MAPGDHIDVMTTLPNRYASFHAETLTLEETMGFRVERIKLPSHKSGMIDQAKAFIYFAGSVLKRVKKREYDFVFATSSRLMTAALGAFIAKQKKAKLYLDIRDLFLDTFGEVISKPFVWFMLPVLSLIERKTMLSAQHINLVSKGFEGYFSQRYPKLSLSWFSHGIDEVFMVSPPAFSAFPIRSDKPLNILYAGNIGEGQGLHMIIPDLAKRLKDKVHFKIIGDGGKKEALRLALDHFQSSHVTLIPPISRDALIDAYQEADVLFLHLNDYAAFRKVLPSKLFEYAAMGKPIWAGVSGYAAEFIRNEVDNAVIFSPCDAEEAEIVFSELEMRYSPRERFIKKFKRSDIMHEMVSDMLRLI